MDTLPPELLSHIAALCDYKAKIQLSSINRYLRGVVSPLAFEHIYVGWNLRHVQHLKHLSESSLAKHVKCVTLNTEILPPLKKRRWMECLYYTEAYIGNCAGAAENPDLDWIRSRVLSVYTEDELEADWKDFQNTGANQQLYGHYIGEILNRAIQSLPNVECLEFVDKRAIYTDKSRSNSEPLMECSPWKNLLLDPSKYNDLIISDWRECGFPPEPADVSSAFALHHIADWNSSHWSSGHVSRIKELTIEFGHHIPVPEIFSLTSCDPCESCERPTRHPAAVQSIFKSFPNLNRVNIKVAANQLRHEDAVCKEMISGLSEAKNLRELTIDNRYTDRDFLQYFRDRKSIWPRLERLRLSGSASKIHLLNVLRNTAGSLRELELVEMQLSSEDGTSSDQERRWDDCLEKVRQTLQLERARVRSLYCKTGKDFTVFFVETSGLVSEMNKTVENFLTKRVDALPRQEMWDSSHVENALEDDSEDGSEQTAGSASASESKPESEYEE